MGIKWQRFLGAVLMLFPALALSRPGTPGQPLPGLQRAEVAARWLSAYQEIAPVPTLIFDRDEVGWLFAREGVFGDENLEARLAVIQRYVEGRTGVALDRNEAVNIDRYLTKVPDAAVAIPILEDFRRLKMCAVFPSQPNSSERLEMDRILALGQPQIAQGLQEHQVRARLSYRESWMFSLAHELSHCLDVSYLPRSLQLFGENPHHAHQAEAFAEAMAMLIMAREGARSLGERRATIRSLYSRRAGPFLATDMRASFGIEAVMQGGAVYHLSPVIRATQAEIRSLGSGLLSMGLEGLRGLAERMVEGHSLPSTTMSALMQYFRHGAERAIATYESHVERWSDMFERPLADLRTYHAVTERALAQGIDLSRPDPTVPSATLRPISVSEFCPSFLAGDQASFMAKLKEFRSDLEHSRVPLAAQRERSAVMQRLFEDAQKECK